MSMPIQRQSEAFSVFDDGDLRFARDHTSRELPPGLASAISGGPRIHAGMNNPRGITAGDYDAQYDYSRPSMSDLYAHEPRQMGPGEFAQEFPGGEPQHENYDAFREEPQAPLQPLDDMLEHSHRPDPRDDPRFFENPDAFKRYEDGYQASVEPPPHDYIAQFRPHMASFTEARRKDDGPAPGKTAAAISPQVVPGWVGHGYVPGHRVVLPWREQLIPGVVTHLDGQQVGVRWDDGQHSSEEPADLRPR